MDQDTDVEMDDATAEAYARRLGWRSEADFASAPANKKPTEYIGFREFIKKTEGEAPLLRERLRTTDRKLMELETVAARVPQLEKAVTEASNTIRVMHESTKTMNERATKRAREEIQAEMDAAARTGDPSNYDAAKERLKRLDEDQNAVAEAVKAVSPPPPPAPQDAPGFPEVDAWTKHADQRWFRENIPMNQAAIEYYGRQPGTTPIVDRLAQTRAWIEEKFSPIYPDFFPARPPAPPPPPEPRVNARRAAAGAVAAPTGGNGPATPGMTYDRLPADAKAACDQLIREIPGYTREEYVRDYLA